MPRSCSVCSHPATAEISKAIAAGGSKREVAERYELTDGSVFRHKKNCLQIVSKVKPSVMAVERTSAAGSGRFASLEPKELIAGTARLVDEALALLEHAKRADDSRTALAALREARDGLALLMKAGGMLGNDGLTITVDNRRQIAVTLDAKDLEELFSLRSGLSELGVTPALPSGEHGA